MIKICCPNCSQTIKIPELYAGKEIKCLKCKNTFMVPSRQIESKSLFSNSVKKPFYADISFWSLVVSNLVVICLAIKQSWPASELMWVYWGQSVIIGIFWFLKIITLVDFSTQGVKINGRPLEETQSVKSTIGLFFLAHFGFFHLIYFFFLNDFSKEQSASSSPSGFWFVIGLFFVNHLFSFIYNFKNREHERPNVGILMVFPYARIIPMHLTIVFGGYFLTYNPASYLFIFLLLKMFADILMYAIELRGFQDKLLISHNNPLKVADPPRNISFFLRLIVFLGSEFTIGGWILFAISAIVYFLLMNQDGISQGWASLCLIGPCALLIGLYKGFQSVWLLKNGHVGLASVIDIEEKGGSEDTTYIIYYQFLASDGKTYDIKIKTGRPALLIDDKYELLFYNLQKPSTAVLMDYLPGRLKYDKNGNIVIGSPGETLLHLLPAAVVIVGLIVLLVIYVR